MIKYLVRKSAQLFSIIWSCVVILLLSSSFGCARRERSKSLTISSEALTTVSSQTKNTQANDQQSNDSVVTASPSQTAKRININNASAEELEKLPGIGKALAERIIEHREKYGAFRRAEHLIIVRGISDRKFRALRDLITVE